MIGKAVKFLDREFTESYEKIAEAAGATTNGCEKAEHK